MRRKQVYAILLAGIMAAGSAPASVSAAEGEAVQTAAETVSEADSQPAEGTETTPPQDGENTESPEGAEPEPPAPQDTTTPAPQETPTPTPEQTEAPVPESPETPTPLPESSVSPTPTVSPEEEVKTSISITAKDETNSEKTYYYQTLQEAVEAVPTISGGAEESTVITLTDSLVLNASVTLADRNVTIAAGAPGITITRGTQEDGAVFAGDLFTVSQGSRLQFMAKEGADLTVNGASGTDAQTAGSIVHITESGAAFGMSAGVTLTGSNTTANGAAIQNNGGSVVLMGGTISGNTGAKGAVYTTVDLAVQGSLKTENNQGTGIYLDTDTVTNTTAALIVTDVMTDSSISLRSASESEGSIVAKAGTKEDGSAVSQEEFQAALAMLSYDSENYTLEMQQTEEGSLTAVLKAPEAPSEEIKVTDSKITGLEKPLKFMPGKSFEFQAAGAGMDNTEPAEGAVRWNPLYWSTAAGGTQNAITNGVGTLMFKEGIKKAGTHPLYVYFRKQVYTGGQWADTETVESIQTTYQSAEISDDEWNGTTNKSFLTYQSNTLKWEGHDTVRFEMSSTKDCKWYYFLVKAGTDQDTIKKQYKSNLAVNAVKANTKFTVVAEKIPEEKTWVVVAAKPESGPAQLRVIQLYSTSQGSKNTFWNSRPSVPVTPTVTTRAPRTYQVTESTVTGLEYPLQFYPRKFYEFQVTGAGQNDKDPVSGDERWIPQYWSMSVNGAKNTSWQIGSQSQGIRDAASYPLYIFFKKQLFNGSEWVDTGVVEYMKTSFQSASISDDEWNAYIKEYNEQHPDNGLNYDGTGAGAVADLTPTEAASPQDTGASTKSPADTADRSPVGSMSVLAMLSLLAGGYIIVRKRKKEEI